MAKRRISLTFPEELLREPIIYTLSSQFRLATNIHRADVSEDQGWVVLEVDGEAADIEQGITWMTSRGVRVEPALEDTTNDK